MHVVSAALELLLCWSFGEITFLKSLLMCIFARPVSASSYL